MVQLLTTATAAAGDGPARDRDDLGAYPARVYVSAMPERRYLWTARVFVMGAVISLSINIVLALLVFQLAPQIRVQPLLMTSPVSSDDIVQIEPFHQEMETHALVTENMVRQYVEYRESILDNKKLTEYRSGPNGLIAKRSTRPVYTAYTEHRKENYLDKDGNPRSGLTRRIEINDVRRVEPQSNKYWQVEFTAYESWQGAETVKSFFALLTIGFNRAVVDYDPLRANPLGFIVIEYSVGTSANAGETPVVSEMP